MISKMMDIIIDSGDSMIHTKSKFRSKFLAAQKKRERMKFNPFFGDAHTYIHIQTHHTSSTFTGGRDCVIRVTAHAMKRRRKKKRRVSKAKKKRDEEVQKWERHHHHHHHHHFLLLLLILISISQREEEEEVHHLSCKEKSPLLLLFLLCEARRCVYGME